METFRQSFLVDHFLLQWKKVVWSWKKCLNAVYFWFLQFTWRFRTVIGIFRIYKRENQFNFMIFFKSWVWFSLFAAYNWRSRGQNWTLQMASGVAVWFKVFLWCDHNFPDKNRIRCPLHLPNHQLPKGSSSGGFIASNPGRYFESSFENSSTSRFQ